MISAMTLKQFLMEAVWKKANKNYDYAFKQKLTLM